MSTTKSFVHEKTGNIMTCKGRALWNFVFKPKPDRKKPKEEWQYEFTVLYPKGADLAAVKDAATEAGKEKLPKEFKTAAGKWPSGVITPFKRTADNDKLVAALEAADMKVEDWPVFITYKAYNDKAPGIVGPDGKADGVEPNDLYAGRWVRVSHFPKGYNNESKGVRLNLVNLQLLEDAEEIPLGSGRVSAETEFDAVEGAGDDSKSSDSLFD